MRQSSHAPPAFRPYRPGPDCSNLCASVDVCAGAAAVLWALAAAAPAAPRRCGLAGRRADCDGPDPSRAITSGDDIGRLLRRIRRVISHRPIASADQVGRSRRRTRRAIMSTDHIGRFHVGRSRRPILSTFFTFFIHPVSPILVGRSGGGARRLARVDEAVPSYAKSTDRCKEPCSVLIALCKRWDSG